MQSLRLNFFFYMKMFKVRFVCRKYFLKRTYFERKHQSMPPHTETRTDLTLPETSFQRILGYTVLERDKFVQREARFSDYYAWQRENLNGKEFILLDGPPYANGKVHLGHTINKVLKDITLRSQTVQGNKVHFIPGWDCHGLPIELKAIGDEDVKLSPLEIRKKAKQFAAYVCADQKKSFQKWGVIGDWENQCYYTTDSSYITKELQIFWNLFEKGFIYRDLKPVFWSPSSKSALAEAELVYKDEHISNGLTVRFETTTKINDKPVYLLVWTTTPWTLPLNKFVCLSENLKYSIVNIASNSGSYILATEAIPNLERKLDTTIEIISDISLEDLKKMEYRHPWNKSELCQIVESHHVTSSGTGLVHGSPAHGHDDFLLSLRLGLNFDCLVDENGCYTQETGPDLSGLNVLEEGSKYVMDKLNSEVILKENHIHSYPYDWRTDKPVIIRASQQWFIDVASIRDSALEALSEVSGPVNELQNFLKSRPFWCLSRQRKWGVPIPAFYHKESKKPLMSKIVIDHICRVFEDSGVDAWWTAKIEDLFPQKACKELNVSIEDVIRGEDIMDIWFDSGVAWSCILGGKQSDICIEGTDQYGGWFQSLLLTSVASQGKAPYKKVLTHGFVTDKKGRKMSKSVGNVIDPSTFTEGDTLLGVDVLRWWVAAHSHKADIPASKSTFDADEESVKVIRSILHFLLGNLTHTTQKELLKAKNFTHLDMHMLNKCYEMYKATMEFYNENQYKNVCNIILNFIVKEVSKIYLPLVKNELYSLPLQSEYRPLRLYVLQGIFNTLTHAIAPILPHLAEEAHIYHPFYETEGKLLFYNSSMWKPPPFWDCKTSSLMIETALSIAKEVGRLTTLAGHLDELEINITIDGFEYDVLKKLQGDHEKTSHSELVTVFKCSSITLRNGPKKLSSKRTTKSKCLRCRRYIAPTGEELCASCLEICKKMSN